MSATDALTTQKVKGEEMKRFDDFVKDFKREMNEPFTVRVRHIVYFVAALFFIFFMTNCRIDYERDELKRKFDFKLLLK